MKFGKSLAVAVSVAALAGCAVTAPLTLDSTGRVDGQSPKVAITVSTDDASPTRTAFGTALVKAFGVNSFAVDPKAGLLADFALSIGAASDGVLSGDAKSSEIENNPDWIATPRKSKRLDECDAKRMRGTLVLIDRATSAQVYRGTAEQIDCEFSDRDITIMASTLVNDAIR